MTEDIDLSTINYVRIKDEPKGRNRCCVNQFFWYCVFSILINMGFLISLVFSVYPLIFEFYEDYDRYNYKINNTYIYYDNHTYNLFIEFPKCKMNIYNSLNFTDVFIIQSYINTNTVYSIWYKDNNCSLEVPNKLTYSILMLYFTIFLGSFVMYFLLLLETYIYNRFFIVYDKLN